MDLIINGIMQAFWLIVHGDPELLKITFLSLAVSCSATLIALCIGIPIGVSLALNIFRGRRFVVSLLNTGMGAPPVVVGLIVSAMLWRSGPLGILGIMYTPYAIVIAQIIISLPIIAGFTMATIQQLDPKLRLQILALGASRLQMLWLLLKETRLPLLAAVMAGFGAIISEVGASMMVGGNILGQTRVLTTATVMEVSKGQFHVAIALGVILMILVFVVNFILTMVQQRSRVR
jgi:tungstate transport system permease protein